jgi:hypothetical protein
VAVSCAIIQARSTAEYAMTLPIALMPPSARPIATTSLMVNCLRLRLLMVSVSIKPANVAGAGTLWLTARGAAVNPHTQADQIGLFVMAVTRRRYSLRSARATELKFNNPTAPAVKREAEEDWGRRAK